MVKTMTEAFSTRVEGTISVEAQGKNWSMTPTRCSKVAGHRYELPDVELRANDGSDYLEFRWHRRQEERKVVVVWSGQKLALDQTGCATFETNMDWAGGEKAGDKGVKGTIKLDCERNGQRIRGDLLFDACFR